MPCRLYIRVHTCTDLYVLYEYSTRLGVSAAGRPAKPSVARPLGMIDKDSADGPGG